MASYQFVIKANALPKVTASMAFPHEITDVTMRMGEIGEQGTYTVTLSSANELSLDQAVFAFRAVAKQQRAIVGEGRIS